MPAADARNLARQCHHGTHYGRFRLAILKRVIAGQMTPAKVADELEAHLDMFRPQALAIRDEIALLRMARRWSDLPPITQAEKEEQQRLMERSYVAFYSDGAESGHGSDL